MSKIICPLCQKSTFKKKFTLKNFEILKCVNCELVFLNYQTAEKKLRNYYSESYYSYQPNFLEIFLNFLDRYFLWEKIKRFKKTGKVLDVGCGVGELLYFFKQKDWEVYGIDISEAACQIAKKKIGKNIYNKSLEDCRFENNFFDLIILSHVIEHIKDPLAMLAETRRILKRDGIVLIEVPTLGNIVSFLTKENYFAFEDIPGHLFYFTPETLKLLLEKAGFFIACREIIFFSLPFSLVNGFLKKVKSRVCRLLLFPLLLLMSVPIKVLDWFFGRPEIIRVYCQKQ